MYLSELYIEEKLSDQLYKPKIEHGDKRENELIVLIHGWISGGRAMIPLANTLRNNYGYTTYILNLPTTFGSFQKLMNTIEKQLQLIEWGRSFNSISIVGHSMGGIISKILLNQHDFPNLKRFIAIGSPWKGSKMADVVKSSFISKVSYSASDSDLILKRAMMKTSLNNDVEIGLIAGTKPYEESDNIPHYEERLKSFKGVRNDGTVEVDSALGLKNNVKDKLTLNFNHSALIRNTKTVKHIHNFIQKGKF